MSPIGVGIIGTGAIATAVHGSAVSSLSDTQLVAVLSRQVAVGEEFLARFDAKDGQTHTDISAFVADPSVDLAIITSPDRLHFTHAKSCLRSGKHVLLEKPMAINISEAQELVDLANGSGLVLATGYHLRSHRGHKELLALLRAGELGPIRHIRAIWSWQQKDDSNWRARAEFGKWWSLAGVGTHCLDLARWFADDMDEWAEFKAVLSNSIWNGPHDESALVVGRLQSGVTVEVTSSVQLPTYHRVEIFGDLGIAICHGTLGREGAGEIEVNGRRVAFVSENPFTAQLASIVNSVRQKSEPSADGQVGLRAVKDLLLASDA